MLKPGESLPKLDIKIESNKVSVGLKGNPPFLSENLENLCDTDDSFWMIEEDELHI
jgi:hypothetical protein